jgi:hypothetical protein
MGWRQLCQEVRWRNELGRYAVSPFAAPDYAHRFFQEKRAGLGVALRRVTPDVTAPWSYGGPGASPPHRSVWAS